MPVHINIEVLKLKKIISAYLVENGIEPNDEELALLYNDGSISGEEALLKVKEYKKYLEPVVSLDLPIKSNSEETVEETVLADFIPSDEDADELVDKVFKSDLSSYLFYEFGKKYLKQRELEVLWYRYGFDGEAKTLGEVGKILGVTRERVRQIELRALNKIKSKALRDPKMIDAIESYYCKDLKTVIENSENSYKLKYNIVKN